MSVFSDLVGAAVVVGLLTAGCASTIRNVPTRPLRGQPEPMMARDRKECTAWAEVNPKPFPYAAELGYAACMIARHYQAYVQVADGYQEYVTVPDVRMEVRQSSSRTHFSQAKILTDVVECRRSLLATVPPVEKVGRAAGIVLSPMFPPAALGSTIAAAALTSHRERQYAACMEPRGYTVVRWAPTPE